MSRQHSIAPLLRGSASQQGGARIQPRSPSQHGSAGRPHKKKAAHRTSLMLLASRPRGNVPRNSSKDTSSRQRAAGRQETARNPLSQVHQQAAAEESERGRRYDSTSAVESEPQTRTRHGASKAAKMLHVRTTLFILSQSAHRHRDTAPADTAPIEVPTDYDYRSLRSTPIERERHRSHTHRKWKPSKRVKWPRGHAIKAFFRRFRKPRRDKTPADSDPPDMPTDYDYRSLQSVPIERERHSVHMHKKWKLSKPVRWPRGSAVTSFIQRHRTHRAISPRPDPSPPEIPISYDYIGESEL